MAEPNILVQKIDGNIVNIILNRPHKHNAFDDTLIAELTDILQSINDDENTRVVLLSANGKNFSAGADLAWMQRMTNFSYSENLADAAQFANMLKVLSNLSKPTIALIQGAAYGGGVGLIACCDIAIATKDAQFCFSEVKLGLVPATISPYVVAAIGGKFARRYFLTAELFDAETAMQIGLLNHVVANEQLMTTAMEIAKQLISNSPQAITESKRLLQRLQAIDDALIQDTITVIADARISSDGQEGLKAFFAKRKPSWQK